MPSGPPELHARWGSDVNAMQFLEKRGYTLLRSWDHKLPTPDHKPDEEELSALQYLFYEWDFGGAVP